MILPQVPITIVEEGSDYGTPTRRVYVRYFRFPPSVGDKISPLKSGDAKLVVFERQWNATGELEIWAHAEGWTPDGNG